jgi:hypothetical protein
MMQRLTEISCIAAPPVIPLATLNSSPELGAQPISFQLQVEKDVLPETAVDIFFFWYVHNSPSSACNKVRI